MQLKKAIMMAMIEGVLTELMVKTDADNVYIDENTTVAAKLSEIIASLNLRAKSEDVTAEIQAAINALIGGAPETYDTLKELADYIATHEDVVDALNAAIGDKASKDTVTAIQNTINGLGALSKKDKVSEADLEKAVQDKLNAASQGNHSHANKAVLDGITGAKVAEWDGKSKVHVQATRPADLKNGDVWIQTVE